MFTISVISHFESRNLLCFLVLIVRVYDLSYFPFRGHDLWFLLYSLTITVISHVEGMIFGFIVHVDDLSYFPFRRQDFWFRLYMFTISVTLHLKGMIYDSDCTC